MIIQSDGSLEVFDALLAVKAILVLVALEMLVQ